MKLRKEKFSAVLNKWWQNHKRDLPWSGEKDPYFIWLSEIILQQTQVTQGIVYYQVFKKKYPTISALAKASEDDILSLWQGLGYNSRARNMHATAQTIVEKYHAEFPNNFDEIKSLKGIGDYTAAAIASYAFGLPHAAVDANVIRILSRIFGISKYFEKEKAIYQKLAFELLDKNNPGFHNQAMMDFGALICKPQNPDCISCPFSNNCFALQHNAVSLLPPKKPKANKKKRYFHYLILKNNTQIAIRQRTENDIWKQLYEFPLIESKKILSIKAIAKTKAFASYKNLGRIISESEVFSQQLTHQTIFAKFFYLDIYDTDVFPDQKFIWCEKKNWKNLAFPGIIRQRLEKLLYFSL